MKKLMTYASERVVLGFWCIASLLVLANMQTAIAEEALTVEGVWEQVSANSPALEIFNGKTRSITKTSDGYGVSSADGTRVITYTGSPTRIVYTDLEDLVDPAEVHGAGEQIPERVKQQAPKQKIPLNISYTLSADGNFLTREEDAKWLYWDENQNFTNYEIKPGFYKSTFRRVSGPVKVENRADRAYQADCGPIDPNNPNRTTPITTDLCPGNLVAMTYFCGGNTGCPHVCCPKGLPYLNHCDCKCYATSDFDCHSYSKAQEQTR